MTAGEPNRGGRPSKFTREGVQRVCGRMREGMSIRRACEGEDFEHTTFLGWAFDEGPEKDWVFEQYEHARAVRAELINEEILEIADDGTNDWMEIHGKDGDVVGWRINGEAVQRSRLRIESRERFLQRTAPKRYADMKRVQLSGGIERRKRIILDNGTGGGD